MTIKLCDGCHKPEPREWCWDGRQSGCPMGKPPRMPNITCPVCGMTSYHPRDIEMGWCAKCNAYTRPVDPMETAKRILREAGYGGGVSTCTCPGPTMTCTTCPVHGDEDD
jgi:ribosomal protein L37E